MVKYFRTIFLAILAFVLFSCSSGKKDGIPEDDQNFQNPLNPQLNALNDAIQSDPDNPDYHFKRARLYFTDKNFRFALKDINEAIHLDNSNNTYFAFLAQVYRALNKNVQSLKVAKQAESLNSQDPELYILMAQIYFDLNDKKNADFYLNQSAILAPLHSEIYVLKGNVLAKNGDTAAALVQYMTALNKDRQNLNALEELAKIYDAKKKFDSSMVFIVSGKSISNKEPYFDYLSGKVYEHLNLQDAARVAYETALANDSNFYLASINLGSWYYKRNKLSEAFRWYMYGLRYDNDIPLANQRIGEILELSGRGAESIPYYERASLIDTLNLKLKSSLKKLYALYPDRKLSTPPATALLKIPSIPLDSTLENTVIKTKAVRQKKSITKAVSEGASPQDLKPKAETGDKQVKKEEIKPVPEAETTASETDKNKEKDKKADFSFKSLFKKKKKNKDTIQ